MMTGEKIEIWNADGKKVGTMELRKYEIIKSFIIDFLKERSEATFYDLLNAAGMTLAGALRSDEISWFVIRVKGDLEAKGVIRKQWDLGRLQVLKLGRNAKRR